MLPPAFYSRPLQMIDLRSDTVTQPTDAMRAAMASAEMGDDVYLEDPTVERLQEAAAAAVGKEAALFMPTGTMGNLLAVKAHTQPGHEVVLERFCHIVQYEMGGMAWFSSVLPQVIEGDRGILDPDQVRAAIHSDGPYYRARTGLVCVENSHNHGGGSLYPQEHLAAIHAAARDHGVPVHMDGARIFNAAVAQGVSAAEIARHADSVMFCFSKGLSAPIGSALCGSRELIEQARRLRRVVGGGWRQAGGLAAAAQLALDTMVERLAVDHANAKRLALGLARIPDIVLDPNGVQTNIVMFRLADQGAVPGSLVCDGLMRSLKEQQILAIRWAHDTIRMVTHRHIGAREVDETLQACEESLSPAGR